MVIFQFAMFVYQRVYLSIYFVYQKVMIQDVLSATWYSRHRSSQHFVTFYYIYITMMMLCHMHAFRKQRGEGVEQYYYSILNYSK